MLKIKKIFILAMLLMGGFFFSCDVNYSDNEIIIRVENPLPGNTVARTDCDSVMIKVIAEAAVENHEVEIMVYPTDDENDKVIDEHLYEKDAVVTFEKAVDVCGYAAGTEFTVKVLACSDRNCDFQAIYSSSFTVE